MRNPIRLPLLAASLLLPVLSLAQDARPAGPTMAQVLADAAESDWRNLDPEATLYLDVAGGRVVIELAPQFAPEHAANIRTLARQGYWNGLAIMRVQENYVVQWGDPDAGDEHKRRSRGEAKAKLPAEFTRPAADLPFTPLTDGDVYAPQVGWSNGFPAARDAGQDSAWLAHCYGAVGAGRDMAADSSDGTQLYVVIGHSPRHLDRNITLVGRVIQGMETLTTLPRGGGALGFYESPEQHVRIQAIHLVSELPVSQRLPLQVLRTDTATFQQLVESRRNRREDWFIDPVGKVELCNVPIPVRRTPSSD